MTLTSKERNAAPIISTVRAFQWNTRTAITEAQCVVATEIPFTIVADGRTLVTLTASPQFLQELTYGYLFSEGWIEAATDVLSWECDRHAWCANVTLSERVVSDSRSGIFQEELQRKATCSETTESERGGGVCSPTFYVKAHAILSAGQWVAGCSDAFRDSGGVHAAGLFDPQQGPLSFFEDIARHNAVDKTIGHSLMEQWDLGRLMLVRTGRTSTEIVSKVIRAGLKMIVSRGAPTHQAILSAWANGITLVGFARQEGFTVYSHPERVLA